jgi:hypothetical protein
MRCDAVKSFAAILWGDQFPQVVLALGAVVMIATVWWLSMMAFGELVKQARDGH